LTPFLHSFWLHCQELLNFFLSNSFPFREDLPKAICHYLARTSPFFLALLSATANYIHNKSFHGREVNRQLLRILFEPSLFCQWPLVSNSNLQSYYDIIISPHGAVRNFEFHRTVASSNGRRASPRERIESAVN